MMLLDSLDQFITRYITIRLIEINPDDNDIDRFALQKPTFFLLQINSNLEAAAQLNWASGSSSTSFQVGCKYDIDKDTSIRVGENNKS